MPPVVFTAPAIQSLEEVRKFLRTYDAEVAENALNNIQSSIFSLKTFPHKGRPARLLGEGVRELLVPFGNSGYLVAYRVLEQKIIILMVRHQKEREYPFS